MSTSNQRMSCRNLGLWAVLLSALAASACFRTVDPAKFTCDSDKNCPVDYRCPVPGGKCVPRSSALDASIAGTDGSTKPQGSGGVGGNRVDGAGSGGLVGTLDGGGAPDGIDVGEGGAAGGSGAGSADAPLAGEGGSPLGGTGGVSSGGGSGEGGLSGGSGGSATVDAPLAGGGGSPSGGAGGVSGTGGTSTSSTGAKCSSNTQCTLGFCVDGVCCDSKCDGQCQACAETGSVGSCTTVKSGAPRGNRTACAGTDLCQGTCDGSSGTACKLPNVETLCQNESCSGGQHAPASYCNGSGTCPTPNRSNCSSGACATDGSGKCTGACTSTSCPTGQYCTPAGTCATKKGNGTGNSCTTKGECSSDYCSISDGVCCQTDCSGQCQTCNNSTGTCTRVASGQPVGSRSACTNSTDATCGGRCNGSSDGCTYPTSSTSCGAAATCTTPDYASSVASACNSQGACTSATTSCSSGQACVGGRCTTKIATNSATACQVNGQCQSGHCCGGTCRDWNNDSSNCGGCGLVCGNGTTCNGSGGCACPSGTANCDGTGCVDILSSSNHCGPSCTSCYSQAGYACSGGSCTCSGQSVAGCGCLAWNFNDGGSQGWSAGGYVAGTLCNGETIGTGYPDGIATTFDGTQALLLSFNGTGCTAPIQGSVCSASSGTALNGLTFSAKVRFNVAFTGSVSIWTSNNANIITNIGLSTIPANTWTTVTATISDSGTDQQLGINFNVDFAATWAGTVMIDNITIK